MDNWGLSVGLKTAFHSYRGQGGIRLVARPLINWLQHQPHAVVAGWLVRRAAEIEVVGHSADSVGDYEEVGETVRLVASTAGARRPLQGVGLAGPHHPGDCDIIARAYHAGDVEVGRGVGRVGS